MCVCVFVYMCVCACMHVRMCSCMCRFTQTGHLILEWTLIFLPLCVTPQHFWLKFEWWPYTPCTHFCLCSRGPGRKCHRPFPEVPLQPRQDARRENDGCCWQVAEFLCSAKVIFCAVSVLADFCVLTFLLGLLKLYAAMGACIAFVPRKMGVFSLCLSNLDFAT